MPPSTKPPALSDPTTAREGEEPALLESELPGWNPPRRQPTQDPLDPTATTTTAAPGLEDRPADVGAGPSDDGPAGPSSRTSTPGPSRASIAEAREALEGLIGGLAGAASLLGDKVVRGEGKWIARQDECAALAEPLARIGVRHAPMVSGETNDLLDGIEATVVVAGYALERVLPAGPEPEPEPTP